jgi:DNA-binding XRE family transcriptional regulator
MHGGGMEIDMINVNLHNLRMLHDMTQEEVAEKIGVSRQAVAKMGKRGKYPGYP